jgi:DNA-binding MarR family transcriptional regulator
VEYLDVVGLLQAAQVLERNMSVALMYSGLRVPQYRLLSAVARTEQSTVTELSEALRVTRATGSLMVNELMRAGILTAIENPTDRRSFHVRLTELGRNKLDVARSDVGVLCGALSRRYSPAVIRALNAFSATAIHHPD